MTDSASTTAVEQKALVVDAKNRALRTFLQGLGIDVLTAAAIGVYAVVSNPRPIVWAAVGASLARSCVQSAASYVMRRFLDSSGVPTPLPPEPPGEPADPNPAVVPARRTPRRRASG